MWGLNRLAGMALIAGLGFAVATATQATLLAQSPGYLLTATALLTVGLYSSTSGIDLADLRGDVRTIALAVTVGVLAKALIIAGVMYLVFREPQYLILGIAVAQIDPLAVAAVLDTSGMSRRARSLLAAWASFDDPITVILAVYGTAWVLDRHAGGGSIGTTGSVLQALLANLALVAVTFVLWRLLQWMRVRYRSARPGRGSWSRMKLAESVVLVAAAVTATISSLALAIAAIGLFLRPRIDRIVNRTTQIAFVAATFLLGFAVADGINLAAGLLLGVCAFGAQIVVGSVIPARINRTDRIHLAFAQQNGITAIILALLLEPEFPGTIGTVAPAIPVVAILHAVTNGVLTRREKVTAALMPSGRPQISPEPSHERAR